MKPGRFNFYLFLGILLVGAGYYALNFSKEHKLLNLGETGPLIPFDIDTLRELSIESDGYQMELQGQDDQWQLELPVKDLASTQKIEAFIESLNQISFAPVAGLSLSSSPTQYGTEPPLWKLEFSDGFEKRSILVGQDLPVGDGTYIRFPDDKKLYVTSISIRPNLPDSFEEFRDLSFFNGKLEDVIRLEYSFAEQTIETRRDGARSWTFIKPFKGRGNRTEIENLLQKLLSLQMSGVAADRVSDPGVYGIDENSRTLRIEWAGQPTQTIRIGSREVGGDILYVNISGRNSIYTMPGNLIDFLDINAESLRDKRPLPTTAETLQSITILHPEFSTRLTRSGANWVVQGTREQAAQIEKVNALITLWTAPVIESFSAQSSSTNRPDAGNLLRIEFEAKTETEALGKWIFETSLDKIQAPSVEVLSASDQEFFTIPSALLNPSTLKPITFYKPELWSFPVERTQNLEYGLHNATNLTKIAVSPESQAISILRSMVPLSIADEDPEMMPEKYFSDETEKLVFKLPAEDGISRTLLLGNITQDENRFVKLLGNPLVYLVDNSTLQKAISKIEASPLQGNE